MRNSGGLHIIAVSSCFHWLIIKTNIARAIASSRRTLKEAFLVRSQSSMNLKKAILPLMVILGVLKIVAIAANSSELRMLANTLASSPAPSPFYRLSSRTFIQCIFEDGHSAEFTWNHETRSSIEGPHRRVVTFLHMFALARSQSLGRFGTNRVNSMLEFHFCQAGSWGAKLCQQIPRSVHLVERNAQSELISSFKYTCVK